MRVPTYLVETYLARGQEGERANRDRRARAAAGELPCVRFDRSIYVPEDEICFFVFDAVSGREATLAAEQAGLAPVRVVEAVETPSPSTGGSDVEP